MKKIGFIGMGNMAGAIAKGIIQSGFIQGGDIIAYDLQLEKLEDIHTYGVAVASNETEVVKESEFVFIGVKPQVVEGVLSLIKNDLKEKALISIVLGYDFEKYNQLLDSSTRHIFVMPNTPAMVQKGMSLIEKTHSLTDKEFEFVKRMFASIGEIDILETSLMKAGGALSGCGPAFIYMVIEALADGAVKEGIPRQKAYKLAAQTVLGAGEMVLKTQEHPGILKDNVCSPGGTTIRGVEALEQHGIRAAFIDAISQSIQKK
jgi:pyrroline-5-carboxylate reductase